MSDRATNQSHYEVLGVSPSASSEEIRSAFRSLARLYHPDTAGSSNSARKMADINRAWAVLSDPVKRFEYDRSIRNNKSTSQSARRDPDFLADVAPVTTFQPARFPWRGILFFGVAAIAMVVVLHAFAKPVGPEVPDHLLVIGSCIDIDKEQFVNEVSCQTSHDGTVRQLVAFDRDCPSDTKGYLDRQGMGIACVEYSTGTNGWGTQAP